MSRHNTLISRYITAGTFGVVCLFIERRVIHSVNICSTHSLTFSNIIPPYNLIYTYHDMMMHCIGVACLTSFRSKRRIFLSWYDDMKLSGFSAWILWNRRGCPVWALKFLHVCWPSRWFQGVFRFKASGGVEGSKWRFESQMSLGGILGNRHESR